MPNVHTRGSTDDMLTALRRMLPREPVGNGEDSDILSLTRSMMVTDSCVSKDAGETPLVLTSDMRADGKPLDLDDAAIERIARRVLREELEGNTGRNISANVRRMIGMEVERLLSDQSTDRPPRFLRNGPP